MEFLPARILAFACWVVLAVCKTATATPHAEVALSPGSGMSASAQGAVPRVLTMDGSHLARVRESLQRGESRYKHALTVLEVDADGMINMASVSVMEKSIAPPSGDMHDYMSQAPYWWPDPSKPDGLPYIRRDGQRNPEVDRITDHKNLMWLSDAVPTLGLAFYFTGRRAYAEQAARLVRAWFIDPATRMNPNLEFGQGIPGRAAGRAAGIIETRYLPDIIDGVMLLQGSSAWSASDAGALESWMQSYAKWLLGSALGREDARRHNNQETWYDQQLIALSLYTGETAVGRKSLETVRAAIGKEFMPDGSQPRELQRTRAWSYSIFNLMAYMRVAAMSSRLGVDLWHYHTPDGRSLRRGVDYLVPFATRERHFPFRQIGGFRPSALHPVLRRAALGWKNAGYRDIARQIGGGTARLELMFP